MTQHSPTKEKPVPGLGHALVLRALHRALRPIVYLLMKYRVPIRSFERVARRVYVETAMKRFAQPGAASTQARVVLLTGMPRPAVRTFMHESHGDPYADEGDAQQPPAALLAEWASNPNYLDDQGRPRPLPMKNPRPSFQSLAEDAKLDISYGALLEELRIAGCIQIDEHQMAHMRRRFYVSHVPDEETLAGFAAAIEAVGNTFNCNLLEAREPRLYQRQFWLRSVAPDEHDRVRLGLNDLLERQAREVVAYLDGHRNDSLGEDRRALGFGSYLFSDFYHSADLPDVLPDPPEDDLA